MPLLRAARSYRSIKMRLLHTGQHYDYQMSRIFFKDLELPKPDIYLGIGGGTLTDQTARMMRAFEPVLVKEKPDIVMVVGDVNSTLAATMVAVQYRVPVAHIEAGMRSFDRSMPEEINRVVTDTLSDWLFAPSDYAQDNLLAEGISAERIFVVGNIMIDTLKVHLSRIKKKASYRRLGLIPNQYALLTLHRVANVDEQETLKNIIKAIHELSHYLPVVFPAHPRTQKQIKRLGLKRYFNKGQFKGRGIWRIDPLGYLDWLSLVLNARLVFTDSGGVQEETTMLKIPCLTIRDTTEWLDTLSQGTNRLVGVKPEQIIKQGRRIILDRNKKYTKIKVPELWDGHTAQRIIKTLATRYSCR